MGGRILQIHIGGPKRSGKSTLGRFIYERFILLRPVVLDVDEVRRGIFGVDDEQAKISSLANIQFHAWATRCLFHVAIPAVLEAGGLPITTAGHSRRENYDEAKRIAEKYGTTLKYILLDAPSWEETVRRAKVDTKSLSDITDLETDPDQQRSYGEQQERFAQSYCDFQEPFLRLAQGTPEEMAEAVIKFILY